MTATISSFNDINAATGRLKNITEAGFQCRLQEEELSSEQHDQEKIAYIAWESSSGSLENTIDYFVGNTANAVQDENYSIAFEMPFGPSPAFLADMQTGHGRDTASLRYNGISSSSGDVWIDEEQSLNDETNHTTEVVGYMVFDSVDTNSE